MLAALLLQAAVVSWSNLCGGTVTRVNDTLFDYTAPSTPPSGGSCRIIARNTRTGHADTSTALILAAGGTTVGVPFGAPDLYTESPSQPAPFSMAVVGVTPQTILEVLAWAKAKRIFVVLNTTAGKHQNYMGCPGSLRTCPSRDSLFKWSIWTAKMQGFNTPAIRAAVAECAAGGWCIENVMDEPHVSGSDDGAGVITGGTWGVRGTLTKNGSATSVGVDSLCGYMQKLLPGITAGVAHGWSVFEPTKSYRTCAYNISQWSNRLGPVRAYLDSSVALARRGKHSVLMAFNIRNGGKQDKTGAWDCPGSQLGQSPPNCEMTDADILDAGTVILTSTAPEICGLSVWRYEPDLVQRHRAALQKLADLAATKPRRACRRTG